MLRPLFALTLLALSAGAGAGAGGQTGASSSAPRIEPTSPALEDREQAVTADDVAILVRAEASLINDAAWNRADDRECADDETTGKRSLFCALQKACIDVLGTYDHRRVALQEVRFAVEDATRGRDFEHRLRDFNNLPETQLADVMRVLAVARSRVTARLKTRGGDAQRRDLPSYDRVLSLESVAATSANVSIGDVNGDGALDLVLAKGRHWPLVDRVLLGDGRGHVTTSYDLGKASDRSYSGLLVDLDGDHDLDVVISNDDPDPKLVYLNDGKGHFRVGSTFGQATWESRNASVADLNGDGRPDIIVANRTSRGAPANYVCLNRGRGQFDANCLAFSHEPATTVTPADFDGDGTADLAVPHRDRGQSYVYLNGGNATFADTRRIAFGPPDARIRMSEAVDVDKDGLLDLVTIDEARGVGVYFGQRDRQFSSLVEIADGTVTPYALATGDLNRDGFIDIVVGHVEAPSTVYFNDGSGRRFSAIPFGDARGSVYGFAIADLDNDGFEDIAAARSEATNAVYFGGPRGSKGQ